MLLLAMMLAAIAIVIFELLPLMAQPICSHGSAFYQSCTLSYTSEAAQSAKLPAFSIVHTDCVSPHCDRKSSPYAICHITIPIVYVSLTRNDSQYLSKRMLHDNHICIGFASCEPPMQRLDKSQRCQYHFATVRAFEIPLSRGPTICFV